jgi:hypothetical protein
MSKLVAIEGPLRGKVFEVTELASLGRGEACAVRLEGKHISRIHARLERRGDGMVLKDNGSRNGVYVNGQGVAEAVLRADDQIEIGEHVLVFDPTSDPEKLPRAAARVVETLADPFAPGEADERLPKLLGVAASLVSMESERDIARSLLEALMVAVPGAERGFVMIEDAAGQLKPAARKSPAGEEEFYLSSVLQHRLEKERRALIARDLFRREPNRGKPVGILAAPLATKAAFLGLAYLDAKMTAEEDRPKFTAADLRFAAALGAFAAARISQIQRAAPLAKLGEKPLPDLRAAFEKECIVEALRRKKGDLEAAAKLLGLTRATLDEKLKILDLVTTVDASEKPTVVKPAPAPAPAKAEGKGTAVTKASPKPPPPPAPSGPAEWKSVQV